MIEPEAEQYQTDEVLFTTTFRFDWARAPLSMNDRMHWGKKAKITKQIRALTHATVRRVPELTRIEVALEWVVGDKRRRDVDNVMPTFKAMCDGLVDAEIVEDDIPALMTKLMPVIRYEKGATPHFELTIKELRA